MVKSVQENFKIKNENAENIVQFILDKIELALLAGEKVKFLGFGTFEVKERKGRYMKNPRQIGEVFFVEDSKYVKFKQGSALKEAVNGN